MTWLSGKHVPWSQTDHGSTSSIVTHELGDSGKCPTFLNFKVLSYKMISSDSTEFLRRMKSNVKDCTLLSTWHMVGAQSFIAFSAHWTPLCLSWTCVQGRGWVLDPTPEVPIWGSSFPRAMNTAGLCIWGWGEFLLPVDSTITLLLGFYYGVWTSNNPELLNVEILFFAWV